VFPWDLLCLRNISLDTLHKGDTDDDDDDDDDNNNNNNNNNNNKAAVVVMIWPGYSAGVTVKFR
jgi:hypothetical protein